MFLKLPEYDWLRFQEYAQTKDESADEIRKKKRPPSKTSWLAEVKGFNANQASVKRSDKLILSHLLASCSSFSKVQRALAYVLRFVGNPRKRNVKNETISISELKISENVLFKWCQDHLDIASLGKKFAAKEDQSVLMRAHG